MMQMFFIWLLTGNIGNKYYEQGKLDIVRKFSATLRATAWLDFLEIKENALLDETISQTTKDLIEYKVEINKADMTIKFFGRAIHFVGADKWAKLKGGKRDILYCNEASELAYKTEFYQLLMRTKDSVFLDFNPDDEEVRINTEIEQKRRAKKNDVFVDVSTYEDNAFLGKSQVEEIEYMKETDEHLRKVYGLGQYGKLQGRIFNFKVAEIPKRAKFLNYGLDFGFTNDPTAWEAIRIDGKNIYIDELIYETGLTNQNIAERMGLLGAEQREETIADSSEPKSIEEICEEGRNVKPAQKGADSVRFGIDKLKTYKIHVTPGSSNIIREFKKYVWITNKEGKSTGKPRDKDNHAIDGIRYAITHKEVEPDVW